MEILSQEKLAELTRKRAEQIRVLEGLWSRLCNLRGEKVSMAAFDSQINKIFQVSDGRDALAFESIERTRVALENAIKKEEQLKNASNG